MADVLPTHYIFNEEVFGPVVTVTKFSSDDEAIELANATEYGLAAGCWTKVLSSTQRKLRNILFLLTTNKRNVERRSSTPLHPRDPSRLRLGQHVQFHSCGSTFWRSKGFRVWARLWHPSDRDVHDMEDGCLGDSTLPALLHVNPLQVHCSFFF